MSPNPPIESLTPTGKVEDFARPHRRIRGEADNEPEQENDAKKDEPDKIYGWRHYYKEPNMKDFEPPERLADRLDSAPPPPPKRFIDATPGEVMRELVREAHSRGAINEIDIDFTDTKDSGGNKWPTAKKDKISHKFEAGMTLLDVAAWLDKEGFAEVRMRGRTLQMFDPIHFRDKTEDVVLARGKNLIDAPSKGDARDMASDVYIISESGVHGWTGDKKTREKYGRIEAPLSINSVRKWDQAESRGQRFLGKHKDPKQQRVFGIVPERGADPYRNFDIGDFITVVQGTEPERVRVRQVGLSWDQRGTFAQAITTSDLLEPFALRAKKQLKALSGKMGTALITTDDLAYPDGSAPTAPSTPQTSSVAGTVTVYWDGKDKAGLAPVFDQSHVEVHVGEDSDFDPSEDTMTDTLRAAGTIVRNDLPYGEDRYIKFVAVDRGGDRSDPSEEVRTNQAQVSSGDLAPGSVGSDQLDPDLPLGTDGIPPAFAPENVVADPFAIGAIRVAWDEVENHDLVVYEVFASDTTGVDEGDFLVATTSALSAVIGRFAGARLDYLKSYHFVVRATDEDGAGPISEEISASPAQAATGDIAVDTVSAFQINAAQITSGQLTADVSVAGSIFIASYDAEGNPIPDTISGRWAPDGFRMFDLDGAERVVLDPNASFFKFSGTGEFTHLSAESASIGGDNEIAESGVLTLQSGVVAPKTPVSVQAARESLNIEPPGQGYAPAGIVSDGAGDLYVGWKLYNSTGSNLSRALVTKNDGTTGLLLQVGGTFASDVASIYNVTYDPVLDWVYAMTRLDNDVYWVQRVNGTSLSPSGRSRWIHDDGNRQPAVGWDASVGEIMVAQSRAVDDRVRIRHYNFVNNTDMTNGSVALVDTNIDYAQPLRAVLHGNFDYGANRYVVMRANAGNFKVFNSSGTNQSTNEWQAGTVVAGAYWDGSNFFAIGDDLIQRKYLAATTGNYWTSSADSTWQAASTYFYHKILTITTVSGDDDIVATAGTFAGDDVGSPITGAGIPGGTTIIEVTDTTHAKMSANASASASGVTATMDRESLRGPVITFQQAKRAILLATLPNLPTNTTTPPTAGRLYLRRGTSAGPTLGALHLQGADSNNPPVFTITNANFAGAADPTVSTFSDGIPAEIENALGETLLDASYPAKRDYVPAITGNVTNPTYGTGSIRLGRYGRGSDGMIHGSFAIVFGTGMTPGSGFYVVNMPTPVDTAAMVANQAIGAAMFIDSSTTTDYSGTVEVISVSLGTMGIYITGQGRVSASAPVVPNDGDRITGEFHYWPAGG